MKLGYITINITFILLAPLFFLGIVNKVKAIWAGRKGAPIIQPFYDFRRLLLKGQVYSQVTSPVFRIGPTIMLAALLSGALLIPIGFKKSILSFEGDFLLFAYFLGLAKFFLVITAMDTGSSFEGMGASREVSFTALIEPGLFMILASLVYFTGHKSLSSIVTFLGTENQWTFAINVLIILALFIMMIVEGCRVPVDDPNTHLELTMIHEVMVLDNSGPDFAYILYASGLKLFMIAALVANFLIPVGVSPIASLGLFCLIILFLAIIIGFIESLTARMRMNLVPEFVLAMVSIAMIIISMIIIFMVEGV
jgi:formate hydrogenlyase subunit 4